MSNLDTTTDANAPPLPALAAGGPPKSSDPITGNDPQYDAITKADLALTKEKIGSEGGMAAIQKRQDDAYAQRQERMLAQEGATMEDLKPWNAEKGLNSRKTDLWEQFGSPGFVIAMLASAFTAMPMTSALNAGAAAMNAINQGDMDKYTKAFDAWKENSNLTLKRLDIEEHEFNQIGDLRTKNMESWRAQATALAARFNDKRLQILLENGMDSMALEAIDAKMKSKVELADATQRLQDNETRRQITMALLGDSKDPMKMARAAQMAEAIMQPGPKSPEQMAVFNVITDPEFPKLSTADQNKRINDAVRGVSSARYGGHSTPIMGEVQRQMDTWDAEHQDASKEERDAAHIDIIKNVSSAQKPTAAGGMLTDDAAKLMAEQYLAGDKSVFTNLGRGAQGAQNVVKVRNAIMDTAKEQGLSGDDIALRMAEFAGLTSGERALGTRTANVEMFAGEAYKMMDVARKASLDVPRGEFVPANRALLAFEQNTGDPKVVAFGAAINTLVNTYAKAIAGGGQATVSDKDHARGMLEAAFSEEQFEAVLDTLGKELEAARSAPGMVKQGFRDLAGKKDLSGNLGPPPNTIRYDAEGNRVQ